MTDGALPEPARRRLAEARTGAWTSDLSVAEFAALQSVGLDPVGQVLGTTVFALAWTGRRACGVRYAGGRRRLGPPMNMPGLVDSLYAARRAALQRMQDEAALLDADGVVGTRLALTPFLPAESAVAMRRVLELSVIGTAVRARSVARPRRPFVCDLSGQDAAALLLSGWVPTGLVLGVGAVVAHDGPDTWNRTRLRSPTGEVPRWSQLAARSRADARTRLEADVRRHGGQSAVIASTRVDVHRQDCTHLANRRGSSQPTAAGSDHLVETLLVGSAIRRFARGEGTPRRGRTIPVVPLSARRGRPTDGTQLADPLLAHAPRKSQ